MAVRPSIARLVPVALFVALVACGGKDKAAGEQADANAIDPALTGALEDQIMVDPDLAQQGEGASVRRGVGPDGAAVPVDQGAGAKVDSRGLMSAPPPTPADKAGRVTLGQLADEQAKGVRRPAKDCDKDFQYSAAWAARLPADIPLYPDAKVAEAAGKDGKDCRIRIVSFTTASPLKMVTDWYYTTAIRAGFSAEHQLRDGDHVLAGARERDDGAYYIMMRPLKSGGTEVDLIANNGR